MFSGVEKFFRAIIIFTFIFVIIGTAKAELRAYYKFDDLSNFGKDSSGCNKNFYVNPRSVPLYTTGYEGYAFSGTGSSCYKVDEILTNKVNTFTLTAWVKKTSAAVDNYEYIVFDRFYKVGLHYQKNSGEINYSWGTNGSPGSWRSNLALPMNEWVFVAMVIEPNKATVYQGQNGQLHFSVNQYSHAIKGLKETYIGGQYNYYSTTGQTIGFFKGIIDNLRIYNNALSYIEILSVMLNNAIPTVEAGANQITEANSVQLNGSVSDDGKPNPPGTVTTIWSKVSGPDAVIFEPNVYVLNPIARFSSYGVYVLKLDANDNQFGSSDTVTITYKQNEPPIVEAGQDKNNIITKNITLSGSVQDDGLPNPPRAVTVTWSQVSGPGTATFSPNANVLNPTAQFSVFPGTYVLKLTASDGQLEVNDIITITYKQNDPPIINIGENMVTDYNSITLNVSVKDDGFPSNPGVVTTVWSQVGGPGEVTFEPNEFVLNPLIKYEKLGVYLLELSAKDGELESNDILKVMYSQNGCAITSKADLNFDCKVDYEDILEFSYYWLDSDCASPDCAADLDADSGVTMKDLSILNANWQEANPAYKLYTDDTQIDIGLNDNNEVIITRFFNPQQQYNWLAHGKTLQLPAKVWINSVEYQLNWQRQDSQLQSTGDSDILTITFTNTNPALTLKSIWTAHPNSSGPIQHRMELTNNSSSVVEAEWLASLNLDLRMPDSETVQHWWVEKGAGNPSDYGTNVTTISNSFSYTGVSTPYDNSNELVTTVKHEPVPWQCVHATASNHGFYTGIESSGCVMQKLIMNNGVANLTLGIDQTLSTFRSKLQPLETFEFPQVFVGCFKGNVDEGSNQLRRWVENRLILDPDNNSLPLLVNNSWGKGISGATESGAIAMINDCQYMGLEMFHMDAGWYQNVGYWYDKPDKFPSGMRYVSDYAHSKGVKFGVWCAWQLGGNISGYGTTALSIYGTGMSNWFSSPGPETSGSWKFESYGGAISCLAYQSPRNWILTDMNRVINTYALDHLEHDRRVVAQTCTNSAHGHMNNSGDISHRAAKGYYLIHDTLKQQHPNLILEDCVMGGRMIDYGVIQHSHYFCSTDDYDPLSLRQAFYDISYAMPPRLIEGYISKIELGTTIESLRYNIRSTMMGWCTIMMDTSTDWTSAQKLDAKHQFTVYKEKIRPQIRNGDLYHITNRPTPAGIDAIEYYTPENGTGVVFAFRSPQCSQAATILYLKGLDADANYQVEFEDGYGSLFTAIGQQLMNDGISVTLPNPSTSELIYITRQ